MPAPAFLNLLLLFLVGGAAPFAFAGILSSAGMLLCDVGRLNFVLLGSVGCATACPFTRILAGTGMLGVWRSSRSLGSLPVILRGRIDAVHGAAE